MRFAGNFNPEWGYLAPAPSFMRTARIVAVATAIGATAGAAVVLSLIDRPASDPTADASRTLVVVRSLVQPAEAAAPAAPGAQPVAAVSVPATSAQAQLQANAGPAAPADNAAANPPAMQASAPVPTQPAPLNTAKISAPVPSESHAVATPAAPAAVASLAESPLATAAAVPGTGAMTRDAVVSPNPSSAPPAEQRGPARKLPATTAGVAGQPLQHGPGAPGAKKKPGNDGLGPILRRLFSSN